MIFFTGKEGWSEEALDTVALLRDDHTLVIGVTLDRYLATIQSDPACRYLAGELIRLAQSIQNERDVDEPIPSVIAGIHEGAYIARRAYEQYPKDFNGELLLDTVALPEAELQLCPNDPAGVIPELKRVEIGGHKEGHPTLVLNEGISEEERARRIHEHIETFFPSYEAPMLSTLPLIFLPAPHHTKQAAVVFLSGDGGWADIDVEVSRFLNKNGYSVLGFDALKFYWSKKDSEESVHALMTAMEIAKKEFSVQSIIVIGFSLGADAAPFMVGGS